MFYNDIEGLTNLIRDCDFIITIGNITAHIAGSIGKPCFVIEPRNFQTIWYWHNGGESIWYPNTNIQFFENDRNIKYCLDEIKKLIKSN